jgi:hypothetical protein
MPSADPEEYDGILQQELSGFDRFSNHEKPNIYKLKMKLVCQISKPYVNRDGNELICSNIGEHVRG